MLTSFQGVTKIVTVKGIQEQQASAVTALILKKTQGQRSMAPNIDYPCFLSPKHNLPKSSQGVERVSIISSFLPKKKITWTDSSLLLKTFEFKFGQFSTGIIQ